MFAVLQSFVILLGNQGNRGGNNSQIFFFPGEGYNRG